MGGAAPAIPELAAATLDNPDRPLSIPMTQ